MSLSPLNFTTSAELYAYANWFHVASVIIMCNNNDFTFIATYDHKGYYGTFVAPTLDSFKKRTINQEPYSDSPTPINLPTICGTTDLTTIELDIDMIVLDTGIKGLSAGGIYNESLFRASYEKSYGNFYKYGKVIFNTVQPLRSTDQSASLLTNQYRFTGTLADGEFIIYQSPSMFSGIITFVGFVNAMFRTWQTETQLLV